MPHALFDLDATIEALPKQKRTQIEVTRLALLGDALTAELRGLLYDRAVDGDPLIERLHVGFDAEPLVRLWPELVEGKAHASVELERFAVGWPSARFLDHGKLALSVRAPSLLVHLDRQTYRAERLGLDAHLTLPNPEHPKDRTLGLVLKSEVGKAVAELLGLRAELAGHALELRVEGLTPATWERPGARARKCRRRASWATSLCPARSVSSPRAASASTGTVARTSASARGRCTCRSRR